MRLLRRILLLASMTLGCSDTPSDAASSVSVDVVVSPTVARLDDILTVIVKATNDGGRAARWSSGCGLDLSFRILNAGGEVVEAPEFGPCTKELRELHLEAHSFMIRTIRWRLGTAGVSGRPFDLGAYRVEGLLGLGDTAQRAGQRAAFQLVP